jgi:hypothetical protein
MQFSSFLAQVVTDLKYKIEFFFTLEAFNQYTECPWVAPLHTQEPKKSINFFVMLQKSKVLVDGSHK